MDNKYKIRPEITRIEALNAKQNMRYLELEKRLWPPVSEMNTGDTYVVLLPPGINENTFFILVKRLCKAKTGKTPANLGIKLLRTQKRDGFIVVKL